MPENHPTILSVAAPHNDYKVHPLGPLVSRAGHGRRRVVRLWAVFILCGLTTILLVAARLTPDPRGYGTHQALGLPDCGLVQLSGYPCPTCGMTTAFAHTVRGQWTAAIYAQPAGWLACLAVVGGCVLCFDALVVGRHWRVNWYRVSTTWVAIGLVGLLLGGWAFKIVLGLAKGTLPAGG